MRFGDLLYWPLLPPVPKPHNDVFIVHRGLDIKVSAGSI